MIGRGGGTRTLDFLLPKQALYQAELRPDDLEGDPESPCSARSSQARQAMLLKGGEIGVTASSVRGQR